MNKWLLGSLGVVFVLVVSLVWGYAFVNGVRNDGIDYEQTLNVSYEDNQNYLSAYVSKIYEQLGLANRKSAVLDTILTNAVKGRYGDKGFSSQGAFFSAVKEAYPDLTQNLNIFDKIADQVAAGREQFRGRQSKLLDEIRVYNTWRQQGIFKSQLIRMFGFPTNQLQARIGGKVVAEGQLALDKMTEIITTGSTQQAYTTGTMEPLQTNK